MYIIKSTEQNREKASDFETFSLLYLLGIHNDHNSIDLVLIDCLNDVTGTNETVTEFWDIQSKGHKKITPLQIGEFLVTLYENYISQFPFKHLILLLEVVQDIHIVTKTNYFDIENYTAQSKFKIKEGLTREYCRRQKIDIASFVDKRIDTFLSIVEFSVSSKDKAPAFNDEVQEGRGLNPSPVATKTCIVCLPQQQNAGASPWIGIAQKSRKSTYIYRLQNGKKYPLD